jgi:hypothetical protein
MCEPVLIASAALAAAGAGATAYGNAQSAKATNSALMQSTANTAEANRRAYEAARATTEQQAERNKQGVQAVTETVPAVSRPAVDAAAAAAAAQRQQQYRAAAPAETGYLPGQSSAPQVVRDAVDAERAKTAGTLGAQADALAQMRGWSDALFGVGRNITGTQERVQRIGGAASNENRLAQAAAAGQAQLGNYRQSLDNLNIGMAGQTGNGWRTVGSLASGVGNLGIAASGSPLWGSIFGGPAKIPASASAMSAIGRAAGPV